MSRKLAGPLFALAIILFLVGKYQGNSFGLGNPHNSVGSVAAGPQERSFIKAVLADLGAPASSANVNSLATWFTHEFSSWPPSADWNPMASTQSMPGATNFNTFGNGLHVRNYPDPTTGARATAITLNNGHYPTIIASLRNGSGLCGSSHASEFRTWSGGGYSSIC